MEVEGTHVYSRFRETQQRPRGIHVIVLNEMTGDVMANNVFDTYTEGEDKELVNFVSNIKKQRIIIFSTLVRILFSSKLSISICFVSSFVLLIKLIIYRMMLVYILVLKQEHYWKSMVVDMLMSSISATRGSSSLRTEKISLKITKGIRRLLNKEVGFHHYL